MKKIIIIISVLMVSVVLAGCLDDNSPVKVESEASAEQQTEQLPMGDDGYPDLYEAAKQGILTSMDEAEEIIKESGVIDDYLDEEGFSGTEKTMMRTFLLEEAMEGFKNTLVKYDHLETDRSDLTEIFEIGDEIKMGDRNIIVNSARAERGREIWEINENKKYVVLNITIRNNGEEEINSSTLMDFKLVDMEGISQNYRSFSGTEGDLNGRILPGRQMRGEISFEVDDYKDNFELEYSADIFGRGTALINIPVK